MTTATASTVLSSPLPACWGHRGASAAFPENTLASFEAAIRDGAEGIESDVHVSADSIIVMFHDAYLERVTNGTGLIKRQPYLNGIDQLRTRKTPLQPIPTFEQTMELISRPENAHVHFNLDIKVDNDPDQLFTLMHDIIVKYPEFESQLAPRLILGLWHPKFIEPAKRLLPYCTRIHIGFSTALARKHFWNDCEGFSMNFNALVGQDGEAFRKECKLAGKKLFVWTVNARQEMIEATKWGVNAVLTDKTADFLALRSHMQTDWDTVSKETTSTFGFTSPYYYTIVNRVLAAWQEFILTRKAGSFDGFGAVDTPPPAFASLPRTTASS